MDDSLGGRHDDDDVRFDDRRMDAERDSGRLPDDGEPLALDVVDLNASVEAAGKLGRNEPFDVAPSGAAREARGYEERLPLARNPAPLELGNRRGDRVLARIARAARDGQRRSLDQDGRAAAARGERLERLARQRKPQRILHGCTDVRERAARRGRAEDERAVRRIDERDARALKKRHSGHRGSQAADACDSSRCVAVLEREHVYADAPEDVRTEVPRAMRLALGVAVFVSGAVLLGVEIAASRVLAPFFGNSLFVWGALIGVVLTGLAVGYWIGGALADRWPGPGTLVALAAAAAASILAIPLCDHAVLEAVVAWDPGPRLDPLVAAIVLFGPPSVLLAGVTPVAVRLATRSLAGVGGTAGRLFAVSTAGSIAGTFATAFFLVPEYGTDQLLAFAAAGLFLAVASVTLAHRMALAATFALVAASVAASMLSLSLAPTSGGRLSSVAAQNWSPLYRERGRETILDARDAGARVPQPELRVVFARDTRYHRLAVVEDETTRYLRFDNSLQSAMFIRQPFRTRFRYTDLFHLGLAYNRRARDILFIGLGAGSSEKRMWRDFPSLRIQAVELDPVVVDVAYRYFHLPRSPRLRVAVDDGRRYLVRNERRWDVIVIDAFFADAIPFHLVTRQFVELARARLAPGGVVVTNAIGAISGPGSKLFRSIYRTYRSVFPTVLVHPAILAGDEGNATFRNLILVAGEQAAPSAQLLAERWERVRRAAPTAPDLRRPILDRHEAPITVSDVPTLTDDYAPTDALLLLFSQ